MFKELLAIFVQFQAPSQLEQVSSFIFSGLEAEILCKNGIVGLEAVWVSIYMICGFKEKLDTRHYTI